MADIPSRQALAESIEKTKNEPVGNFRRRRWLAIVLASHAALNQRGEA
jgi:hypothetical protein